MIEIKATVIDRTPSTIWVKTNQGCMGCRGGCGLGEVGRFLTRHHGAVTLTDHETTSLPGDEVTLALSESTLLLAGLLVYLIPALFMVLGATLGTLLANSDNHAILGTLGGFVLGMLLIRFLNHHPLRPLAPPQLIQTPYSTSGDLNNECDRS